MTCIRWPISRPSARLELRWESVHSLSSTQKQQHYVSKFSCLPQWLSQSEQLRLPLPPLRPCVVVTDKMLFVRDMKRENEIHGGREAGRWKCTELGRQGGSPFVTCVNESYTNESVISHVNESWHMWMSHGTYEWGMAHVHESWHICKIWGSYDTKDF